MTNSLANKTGHEYSDNEWLKRLISWWGNPTVDVRDEIWTKGEGGHKIGVRTFVWFPPKAYTNHNIKIVRRPFFWTDGTEDNVWSVKMSRHALHGYWRPTHVEIEYSGLPEPTSSLIESLYQFVGFCNYD
jgi:hypothetical protein